jgi:hypothetical protein
MHVKRTRQLQEARLAHSLNAAEGFEGRFKVLCRGLLPTMQTMQIFLMILSTV